jgi:aryl-alcohol dehydrogenase-like predicted oxidoreductase
MTSHRRAWPDPLLPRSLAGSPKQTTDSWQPRQRLGLATRGDTNLRAEDVCYALDRGVTFLNWCGQVDALSQTVAGLGLRRQTVVVCVQFEARTAEEARLEWETICRALNTEYVDILTYYYVEEAAEWEQLCAPGGALEFGQELRRTGVARWLGLTTHQRPLAAAVARSGLLDVLMIRYNAAHRGAETEVFPITRERAMPVIAYTCLRWGALLRPTPNDPPGWVVPGAPAWYRFVLEHPAVTVALMAPDDRKELEEDLTVLEARPMAAAEYQQLAAHGQRVHRHAGSFP